MTEDSPVLEMADGAVRGLRTHGVLQFRGVPYASTTGGANRFRPPQPVEPWTGIRNASSWGAMSPQPAHTSSSLAAINPKLFADAFGRSHDQPMDEDCLTVHVWTPDKPVTSHRPVMVWLHGGGFDHGTSATPRTDGSELASKRDIVVVSVTHRLGALGYAYLKELDPSFADSANVGLLDIVAALHWIERNVGTFGGDPANVTLFGESGGGCKVSSLMAMPAARGLFHKAIIQSGPFAEPPTPPEATVFARILLGELGIDASAPLAPQLETVEATAIAEAQEALVSSGRLGGLAFSPVLDGITMTESQFDAVTVGGGSDLPLLIGFNENEWGSFGSGDPATIDLDEAGLRARVAEVAGRTAGDVIAAYRDRQPGASPGHLWARMMSHRILMLSTWDLVDKRAQRAAATTFSYLFTWFSPNYEWAGSFHGIEGGFVFDTTADLPLTAGDPTAMALADTTSAVWAAFARAGELAETGGRAGHSTLILDATPHIADDPFGRLRAIWRTADEHRAEGGDG
jgi:para-nitrobenzyl esterase